MFAISLFVWNLDTLTHLVSLASYLLSISSSKERSHIQMSNDKHYHILKNLRSFSCIMIHNFVLFVIEVVISNCLTLPQVVELVRKAVPLALTPENDPRREELNQLQKKKEEIDMLAHKQVRRILWSGLGFLVAQIGLFFRLTFWELSWDIMEPIAFFTTTAGLIAGYAYFLITSRDPTYQDLLKRLFLSRQRKLMQKNNFSMEKYMELQKHCKCPLDKISIADSSIPHFQHS